MSGNRCVSCRDMVRGLNEVLVYRYLERNVVNGKMCSMVRKWGVWQESLENLRE